MLSLDISRCLWMKWMQSVTAGRRRTSTLLLHFFNQREKKALFWPVCQRRPATTPLQPQPTLSPLRCNRQIKKKNSPSWKSGDGRSHLLPHVLSTYPPPFLLFPCLLFISSCFFSPSFVKPVKKPLLINFSLLIFVCISCFVLLDVLIRPVFGPRLCFAKQFPLQQGNELKSRRNISLARGDSREAICRRKEQFSAY